MARNEIKTVQEARDLVALELDNIRSSTLNLQFLDKLKSTERKLDNLKLNRQETNDPETQELQEKLAQLKQEWQTIMADSEESKLASLTKEKAQLDQHNQDTNDDIRQLESNIRDLRQELSTLEQQDDEQETDAVSLQLAVFRGLGVRMLSKDDKFVTALLANDKYSKVNTVDITKGYSQFYLAKVVWQFISM
ncbi:hypothetical protein BDB00DRAFT_811294 [Zychaea mexicana]|uniref:uncharacterized protein n=1 Tax=Zychaea mexicana TaxID=64656 RepID=UPI0022FE883E|nr:uncharacterized protein BDB00DRAFT_811294 [Zychaea mexicana]KAI9495986.1 hypothetical protein BDB00DRAFT_811294 [Zychaea mexicana]